MKLNHIGNYVYIMVGGRKLALVAVWWLLDQVQWFSCEAYFDDMYMIRVGQEDAGLLLRWAEKHGVDPSLQAFTQGERRFVRPLESNVR